MISIRISKKSLREIDAKIKKLIERIDNPKPLLNDIAHYMVRVTQNRLTTTKKGPDGKRWADNSELTQYLKGRNNPNYWSGELASSIQVIRKDRWGFSIGSKLPYAPYVQNGVKVMRGRYQSKTKPQPQIPARPYLGFSQQNKHKIAQMIREYIRTGRDTIPEDAE